MAPARPATGHDTNVCARCTNNGVRGDVQTLVPERQNGVPMEGLDLEIWCDQRFVDRSAGSGPRCHGAASDPKQTVGAA